MHRPKILLLGKLPPPYMGPAIATNILLRSRLNEAYKLLHVNTNVHKALNTIGTFNWKKVGQNLAIYRRLIKIIRTEWPDLVLVPISQSTVGFLKDSLFIVLSRLLGRKVILQLRGSDFKNWLRRSPAPVQYYVRHILRMTEGVIVLGENLKHLFDDFFPADRIYVVPNGADYEIPDVDIDTSGTATRFLYLANLQASKGILDVVRGALLLKNKGIQSFHLDVVGAWRDPDTEASCRQLVADNALPVTFHGPAYDEEKFLFMAQADVFVFTPRAPEGHPWVIVEAMASGLPIIATDKGAIVESVIDGENGFIVEDTRPDQIAEKMARLLAQPDLMRSYGAASYRRYRQHFTEDRMVERLSGVFRSALRLEEPHYAFANEEIY